jgi:hypothetical protein
MYRALWQWLPGGFWSKLGQLVAMTISLLLLLFFLIFPAIHNLFFLEQSTLG